MAEIKDLNESWNDHEGNEVESFVKKYLGEIDNKIGDALFDPTTYNQILFASTEDKMAYLSGDTSVPHKVCPFEFTGTVRRMTVVNLMDSKNLYYTQMSGSAIITVGFKSEEKGITDAAWSEATEDARITVEIDRGLTGKYETIVSEQLVLNGNTLSVDVFRYLATGNNRVRVTAVGVDTGSSGYIVYSALLTSMYIAPANFKWNVPFIEGNEYQLGGLYIGGALDKILKIKVSNEQTYLKTYEINIGSQTHTSIAYYYGGLEFPTEGTGIYTVEMWLDANGLESEHLSYNIMCIAADEVNTAQLIAVSNVLPIVKNFDTNKLYSYAVYNGGASTASPTVNVSAIINNTPTTIIKSEVLDNVQTGIINDYIVDLEIDTQETNIQLYSSIELGESKQEAVYKIDNSASFPAIGGAMFYLNPANRNNAQANRTTIINESNLAGATHEYAATWENVSFTDGMDGWTVDNEGRKCLRLPAGCKLSVDYAPFANARTRTIEISYRVENTSNFNEDIISIATDLTEQFVGARIKPTNVLLHSTLLRTDDLMQGYNTKDEELVHLLITVIQNYKQIGNLAQIYVNGVKKCSFEWSTSDTFAHDGKLNFGSNTADLYIYKTRVYIEAFDWIWAIQNFKSCLPDTASKKAAHEKMRSVINDGNKLDLDQVKNNGYNYFVLRLPQGASLPSILSQTSVKHSRLEINIQQNPSFAINGIYEDEETEGQGTTAMDYFRWNLRWKTEIIRITAKKNMASSMHSHKMGGTALFNDLNRMIVGPNEADARVAVEQYGAYGFLEVLEEGTTDKYTYIPIGLYTIGQDKGDKTTFGYNNKTYKDTLIHLEGSDHKPKAIGMDYPWNKLSVHTNSEGDSYLGVKKEDGSAEKAWEIGACGSAESDADMLAYLTQEFYPAYDCDYRNTMMLVGVESGTDINSLEFMEIPTNYGFTNADCLVWIDGEYETYYYDDIQKTYLKDGINILDDLGISASDLKGATAEEKNQEIIELRKARYRAEMENYWHLRDNLFHYCFVILFAATDNFKKNTYPYKFGTLASGSRWRWRQDDLDTLADINNQGLATKIYSILNGDKSLDNQLFNGNTSYHWTNIQFYYENEIRSMMLEILTAMASLSDTGDSLIEKAVGCIRKYFWNKAQDYFTKSAYNLDAEWTYEEAWAAMKNGTYTPPVHPLQQSLGDHYEAERAWFELRFIFMASLYGFGAFGIGNSKDTSLGQISFRLGKGTSPFEFTPTIDMNPTILIGDSNSVNAGRRVKQNEKVSLPITTTESDTSIYIQGADYLSDIGDFSKVNLYPGNPSLTVQSKRLQKLKVGDENAEDVTTIMKTLTVLHCPSLSEVDARNVKTLTGSIDLSQCPRLRSALFGGSSAGEIILPKGSKIEEFELPDTIDTLSLLNLPRLTEEGLVRGDLTALTYLRVENNTNISGYGLLKATIEDGAKLKNIRIIGFDYEGNANDLDLLAELAKRDDSGQPIYQGIDSDGSRNPNIIPVIEGTLHISTPVYEDSLEVLTEAYGNNLVLDITGGRYIRFSDKEVLRVLREKGVDTNDDGGITEEEAAKVTSIGTWFKGNTTIESFDEFEKFTGMTSLNNSYNTNYGTFNGCTSLKSVAIPASVTYIGGGAFQGCTVLEDVGDLSNVKTTHNGSFADTPALAIDIYMPSLTEMLGSSFLRSGITKFSAPNLPSIPAGSLANNGAFTSCANLTEVDIPSATSIGKAAFASCILLSKVEIDTKKCTLIGDYAFQNCTSLSFEELNLPNLTSLGLNAFYGVKIKKLVLGSDGVALTLPAATNSTQNFGDKSVLEEIELHGVTSIPDSSVRGYTALNTINIPQDVAIIGISAFAGNTNMIIEDLSLPNLTSLGKNSFWGTKIKKVSNLGSITTLVGGANTDGPFNSCPDLRSVRLPATLTSIGNLVFYGCTLDELIMDATTPPTLGSFRGTINAIYVPDASVEAYRTATGWSTYADRIKSIIGYAEIGILDKNNKVWSVSEWSGDSSDVVGIAMRGAAEFVIAKDEHTSIFGSGLTDGVEGNGRVLTDYLLKNWGGNSVAANYCNSYMFTNGQNGYLPSQDEMVYILTHFDAVNEALSLVGGTLLVADSAYWGANCNGNDSFCAMKTSSAVSKINQQKTFNRKMRILTELPEGLEW